MNTAQSLLTSGSKQPPKDIFQTNRYFCFLLVNLKLKTMDRMTFLQFSILENFKAGFYRECDLLLFSLDFILQMNPGQSEIQKSMVAPALKNEVNTIGEMLSTKDRSGFKNGGGFGWTCCYCAEPDMTLGARRQCSKCQKEFDLCFQKNRIFLKSPNNTCGKCKMVSFFKSVGRNCPFCRS